MSEFFYFIPIITIILLLCLFSYYIVCLPFDYCGNLTTAHPVVKVCAADSQAIPSLYDLSGSLVNVLAELSLFIKSVWLAALCQPRVSAAVE